MRKLREDCKTVQGAVLTRNQESSSSVLGEGFSVLEALNLDVKPRTFSLILYEFIYSSPDAPHIYGTYRVMQS